VSGIFPYKPPWQISTIASAFADIPFRSIHLKFRQSFFELVSSFGSPFVNKLQRNDRPVGIVAIGPMALQG